MYTVTEIRLDEGILFCYLTKYFTILLNNNKSLNFIISYAFLHTKTSFISQNILLCADYNWATKLNFLNVKLITVGVSSSIFRTDFESVYKSIVAGIVL